MDGNTGSSRRQFLGRVAGAGAMAGIAKLGFAGTDGAHSAGPRPIVYFSKHLQWLDWEHMAETAAELGFDGLDVTVRHGGHVEPERVSEDLPKVAKIVRAAGLEIPMITAGIVDIHSPHAEEIIRTASECGITRYRWGWFSWSDTTQSPKGLLDVPARLAELKPRVAALAELNARYKVTAMYHNHSGPLVGASVWDLWSIIKDFDPQRVGSNFDVGHATVEGGLGGWVTSTRLMTPFMRGVAIKDFKWGKNKKDAWDPLWCPLGEDGMVHFPYFFSMLKQGNFTGPIQLHTEYPLGGIENGTRTPTLDKSVILAAIRKDLTILKGMLKDAELT